MRKLALWSCVALLALAGCGDDTSKGTPNNEATPDMGVSDSGGEDDASTGGEDTGGGADDMGGGGEDTGGGGTDMGGGGTDMSSGADMATSECGNLIVEPGEDCDDNNDDPTDGCNSDCTFTCGDGVVGTDETCDTAIPDGMPGACPTACDDGDACTMDTLQGSECTAECVFGAIAACVDGDMCCPAGGTCNANNDNDCTPMCGNGVVEGAEVCDGSCPADANACDDNNACTDDVYSGAPGTCDAMCANNAITACADNDGCCPSTCDSTNDNDCSASCGNGIVETPEICDGDCPTLADCDDQNACTDESLTGSAGNCNAACAYTDVTSCSNTSDGCCPSNCDSTNDVDCVQVCGNGTVEGNEQCDDGGTVAGDGCDDQCMLEPVAFRMSDLVLKDPHVYVSFFLCLDATNSLPGSTPSINELLSAEITEDADGDGELDLSFVVIFRPLDQTNGASGTMTIAEADCTDPIGSTSCTVDSTVHFTQDTTYTVDSNNTCLDIIPGTVGGYSPAVTASTAPCWSSLPVSLTVDVAGIQIPLEDTQVAATLPSNPATSFTNGLLRGFISETTADSIIIPDTVDVVGGSALSSLLAGGTGSCASGDDRDMHNGELGWWFYFNFPADQVPFTEL